MVAISSGLSHAPRTMLVEAMVAVAMTEVGLVLLSLERGNIRGEKEEDGWSKRTGPQRGTSVSSLDPKVARILERRKWSRRTRSDL